MQVKQDSLHIQHSSMQRTFLPTEMRRKITTMKADCVTTFVAWGVGKLFVATTTDQIVLVATELIFRLVADHLGGWILKAQL
jgi:hypothetical protein